MSYICTMINLDTRIDVISMKAISYSCMILTVSVGKIEKENEKERRGGGVVVNRRR